MDQRDRSNGPSCNRLSPLSEFHKLELTHKLAEQVPSNQLHSIALEDKEQS